MRGSWRGVDSEACCEVCGAPLVGVAAEADELLMEPKLMLGLAA